MWLHDLDILVNFLIIIDLGVFFILIAFLLNLTRLFQDHFGSTLHGHKRESARKVISVAVSCACVTILVYPANFLNLYFWSGIASASATVILYDWYSVFQFKFFSDLQLLSDVYFHTNLFEFSIMNIFIYLAVLLIASVVNLKDWTLEWSPLSRASALSCRKNEKSIYQRAQSLQFQVKRTATVRVWNRVSNDRIFRDSTSDLSTTDR